MENEKEAREKILLLFLGMTYCTVTEEKKGKEIKKKRQKGYRFLEVTQQEFDDGTLPDHDERIYAGKGIKVHQPGVVYSIEQYIGKSTVAFGTLRYVGHWPNEEQRLQWQVEYRAFVNDHEAKAMAEKDSTKNLIDEHLAPIREAYGKLPFMRRQAFLTAINYYITRHSSS